MNRFKVNLHFAIKFPPDEKRVLLAIGFRDGWRTLVLVLFPLWIEIGI